MTEPGVADAAAFSRGFETLTVSREGGVLLVEIGGDGSGRAGSGVTLVAGAGRRLLPAQP